MNGRDGVTEVAKVVGKKEVAAEAFNCVLEAAKNKRKVLEMKVALAVIVFVLNFSSLALAAAAPNAAEWESTLAAAKKEGTVVVSGPAGADVRDALMEAFQKRYPGIRMEYDGSSTRAFATRVTAERKAGQFLWDVFIHGSPEVVMPIVAFEPLEPALMLADVKNPKTWRGGAIEFFDPGKTVIIMTPFQRGTIFYNTKLVNAKEFKSYKDLLDPKWKGKIVVDDPRKAGPGQGTFLLFYLHPDLGPDFIRALSKQQLTVLQDYSQELDIVGQGKYPLLVGTADFVAIARARLGVPIGIVDPRQLREGTGVTTANGNLALFNRAPHPNAAKVFINWLLSKEGQTIFASIQGYLSARLDVPTDHLPAWRVPQPSAIKTYRKEALLVQDKDMLPLLQEVFGK